VLAKGVRSQREQNTLQYDGCQEQQGEKRAKPPSPRTAHSSLTVRFVTDNPSVRDKETLPKITHVEKEKRKLASRGYATIASRAVSNGGMASEPLYPVARSSLYIIIQKWKALDTPHSAARRCYRDTLRLWRDRVSRHCRLNPFCPDIFLIWTERYGRRLFFDGKTLIWTMDASLGDRYCNK
jgi:hypothetical protein